MYGEACLVAAAYWRHLRRGECGESIARFLGELGWPGCPDFVCYGTALEAIGGSRAYGAEQEGSDKDIYGFAIPCKQVMFPHLKGEVPGFGPSRPLTQTWQRQGVLFDGEELDITIQSVTKFFNMAMEGQPNVLGVLYAPEDCISYQCAAGELVLKYRHLFLSKACYPKFRGASRGAQKDMSTGENYKPKQGCHAVRLLLELNQILTEGSLDRRRDALTYRRIRSGEMDEAAVRALIAELEAQTEEAIVTSTLPDVSDAKRVKCLLVAVLQTAWGDTSDCLALSAEEEALVEAVLTGREI